MTVLRPGDDRFLIAVQNPLAYYLDERNPRGVIPRTSSPGLSRGSNGLCAIPPLSLRDISPARGENDPSPAFALFLPPCFLFHESK